MELTNAQIDQRLGELPHEVWELENETVKLSAEVDLLKTHYERAYNEVYLAQKASHDHMTVKELEARAFNDTYKMRLEIIETEAAMKATKIKAEEAARKHSSLQSLIKLRVAEIKTI